MAADVVRSAVSVIAEALAVREKLQRLQSPHQRGDHLSPEAGRFRFDIGRYIAAVADGEMGSSGFCLERDNNRLTATLPVLDGVGHEFIHNES